MLKRLILGLLFVALAVPLSLYLKDQQTGTNHVGDALVWGEEKKQIVDIYIDEKTIAAREVELGKEETALTKDIVELQKAIADLTSTGDNSKVRELEGILNRLLQQRAEAQEYRKKVLQTKYETQLTREEARLKKAQMDAAKEQWASAKKMLDLRTKMDGLEREKILAKKVNEFLNALEASQYQDLVRLCDKDVSLAILADKNKRYASTAPTGKFTLKPNGRECEVLFDGKASLRLAQVNGEWLVVALW
jgi:hypothetical protein